MDATHTSGDAPNDVPAQPIAHDEVRALHDAFRGCAHNVLAMNAVCRADMRGALTRRDMPPPEAYQHYTHRVAPEAKAANQRASGRCWLFAALNVLRVPFMAAARLPDDFEFSQAYLFFWDKLEKANWFLGVAEALARAGAPVDGREFQFALDAPLQDGGQWDMAVALVEKYGLVPKAAYADAAQAGATAPLNALLTSRLREAARDIVAAVATAQPTSGIREAVLADVYRILAITLGEPPASFVWEYTDKDRRCRYHGTITPLEFYKSHVVAGRSDALTATVSLVHDPRHEYGALYTVARLGNVAGGRPVRYLNLPIEDLQRYAAAQLMGSGGAVSDGDLGGVINGVDSQLKDGRSASTGNEMESTDGVVNDERRSFTDGDSFGDDYLDKGLSATTLSEKRDSTPAASVDLVDENGAVQTSSTANGGGQQTTTQDARSAGRPVWFGCDMSKHVDRATGVMDADTLDYAGVYGWSPGLSKAERLVFGESRMTHAMALTGVHVPGSSPVRWRVENSWGEDRGTKGYFAMADAWFREYVFQVVVDVDGLDEAHRRALASDRVTVLPPWDPLGALA